MNSDAKKVRRIFEGFSAKVRRLESKLRNIITAIYSGLAKHRMPALEKLAFATVWARVLCKSAGLRWLLQTAVAASLVVRVFLIGALATYDSR